MRSSSFVLALSALSCSCAPCLAGLLCGVLNWGWGLWGTTDSDGMEGQAEKLRLFDQKWLLGSVEGSLLPWAIFLSFTPNRPWTSKDHLWTLFFIEMSKERLEKSEWTPPVSWRPWALASANDRTTFHACLRCRKTAVYRFRSFFSALGSHLASRSLSWPAMPVSNKNQGLSSEN